MDLISDLEELEFSYLESFTKKAKTSWGFLFWNKNNPSYYDANHAHIRCVPNDARQVVDDVIMFYKEKHIIPRLYIYNIENQNKLIGELKAHGFKLEEFDDSIQLWNNVLEESTFDKRITIEQVNDKNFVDALEVECSIKEFGGKEVREKAFREEFKHPSYVHFLLRYNNIPCSTASIFVLEKQARMESVATLNQFRGQGLIGELIYYIQNEVEKRGINKLWVFPINEGIEKVYQKYGFETVSKFKSGHAYLDEKGSKES